MNIRCSGKMVVLADSHCHLDRLELKNYGGQPTEAIAAAREVGVEYMLVPSVDLASFSSLLALVKSDDKLFASLGLHPTEKSFAFPSKQELITLGKQEQVVAIGETGLDFHYLSDAKERGRQEELFRLHVQVARVLNKPLIIHTRDAEQETLAILQQEGAEQVGGVLHCFTGSSEMAKQALELGFYLSFSGIITFRKAEPLREIVKMVPLDRLLIETDAPYLAPHPVRGQINEPKYLVYIAEYLAKFLNLSYESLARYTTENFLRFCQQR